jgi:hypothetical protein
MSADPEQFEELERRLNLFSIEVDGVPIWERIRYSTFREIKQAYGTGQAHTQIDTGLSAYLRGIALWGLNTVRLNPYLADEHNFLFFGHPRRKLEQDGFWWDIYCDPIHEQSKLDYIHLERPHNLSHRRPAKTGNLRYAEFIEFSGTLQRKLGINSPSLPENVKIQVHNAEAEISHLFDADIDLISKVQHTLHVRNTLLPLYKLLLKRINPSIVVTVVSYGDETLIEACKRMNIPVVELQHGTPQSRHYGYVYPENEPKEMFPDYFLSFGEFWSKNIPFPIPDNRVITVGYPYLEKRLNAYNDINPASQILFISQGTIGAELSKFAIEVNQHPDIEYDIVYKLHPGEYDRWKKEYPWLVDAEFEVIDTSEPPLYQLFAESTVQVGVYSTAVYEGLAFSLETYLYDCSESKALKPLIRQGSAELVSSADELASSLGARDTTFDREYYFASNSIENICEVLDDLANNGTTYEP